MLEDQVRTEAQATGKESVGGGPPTMTETFSTISDSWTAARNNPWTVSEVCTTGPPPEREKAPPEAQRETPGWTEGGAMMGDTFLCNDG